ncbi:DUF4266 domain-containing protein [Moritella sp. 5]|uniref:DUF4266 domain-containing protein n=1 Tax=Moritella sp. 5 TaxID=2746231 RepID=UPI001BAC17B1|nr:DUF4266 domain-containing protein [Moritella sp. 5]QUM80289.1 DUF4266 domain-containing protein [Moritella sp. 5]
MKPYAQLTLLSSSLLLTCFGLQAEVTTTDQDSPYQVTESISNVVYKSQETIAEVSASSRQHTAETPTIVVIRPVNVQNHQSSQSVISALPKITMPAVIPSVLPTVIPSALPTPIPKVLPTVIPAPIPVYPVLNASVFPEPVSNDVDEEPSLFSAISDWFSVKPVKPWQKGTLAKKSMKPGGEVPEFDVFSEKVFAYKQGSIGGNGVGGGGCGCN